MSKKDWEKPTYEVFIFAETKGSGKAVPTNQEDFINLDFDENGQPINFVPNTSPDAEGPS